MLKIWPFLMMLARKFPLTYSLLLITLIPCTLIANTWWNLHSFQRDMDFAVRDQALAIEKTFITYLQAAPIQKAQLLSLANQTQSAIPQVSGISVLIPESNGKFTAVATTNEQIAGTDEASFLNSMAWTENGSFFTKTYDSASGQNLWVVVSPFYDENQKKVGVVNIKVKTASVDNAINRTVRDSLIILGFSVVGVILLLINHLRFFETALMVDKLKQIDKIKDDFISIASHELRTPLTAIKGCISMIKEDFKGKIPAELSEWFGMIDISVARLNDLVNDLLNVSRIEQNRLDFALSPVNVCDSLKEVVEQLQFTAKDKGLTLHFNPTSSPVTILANKERINEVWINLIGNAIKYTPTGSVTISSTLEKNTVTVQIQDTGIGIAPEDKERLFQKFSRITTDKTKEIPGTGLGLWITKELVERMKGKIYVDSIVGQGTVFNVLFQSV